MTQWLWCALSLCLVAIAGVLAECNSDECTIDNDPTSINVHLTTNIADGIAPIDLSFVHALLLKELLLATDYVKETAKTEFVEFYKELADTKDMNALNKFDREYNRHSAIWWYTYPGYIHDLLNEALRAQNVTHLLRMGFFIQKVHRQLQHIRETTDDINNKRVTQLIQATRMEITGTSTMYQLGRLMIVMERYSTAHIIYNQLLNEVDEDEYTNKEVIYYQIGHALENSGNLSGALAAFERSFELAIQHRDANDSTPRATISRIADILQKQKKYVAAIEKFEQGLRLELQAPVINYRRVSKFYNDIGVVLNEQEKYKESLEYQEKSLTINLEHTPSDTINIGISYLNIAAIHKNMKNYTSALTFYEKGLFHLEQTNPIRWETVALLHYNIAQMLQELDRNDEAVQHAKQAAAIAVQIHPKNHLVRQLFEKQLQELTDDIE